MDDVDRAIVLMVIIGMILSTVIVFRVASCAEKPNVLQDQPTERR